MKILYYNWIDYENPKKEGGGVTVYQNNLIKSILSTPDINITFLSSGLYYSIIKKPFWKHSRSTSKVRKYQIINSEVFSPAHSSFGSDKQIKADSTKNVFFDFIKKTGPYNVIHFNNLEGLPVSVLCIKESFPEAKIIYSMHNYYTICPQVNLWHQEKENCINFNNGKKCTACLTVNTETNKHHQFKGMLHYYLEKIPEPYRAISEKIIYKTIRKISNIVSPYKLKINNLIKYNRNEKSVEIEKKINNQIAFNFFERRREFVRYINRYCDHVLAVSERVHQIAIKNGFSPKIVTTVYIGTQHADLYYSNLNRMRNLKPVTNLTLCYLGYMRRDKGFYFLLECLESLQHEFCKKINLIFAAKNTDINALARIQKLSEKFHCVIYKNGYSHDELDSILHSVNIGVVPVLWEDNLPQVALEFHCRRIPVITSNLGGAQELSRFKGLVFNAGNHKTLKKLIAELTNNEIFKSLVDSYWRTALSPITLMQHIDILFTHYYTN